jgi:hypothetical protein
VLIFFYYAGHGVMWENETYGVDYYEKRIPIDGWIKILSNYPNTFTIALLDCCRVQQNITMS